MPVVEIMKLKINTYTIASTAFSIISLTSFWIFSKFFDETLIFYLGVPFALSTFLFSYALLRHNDKESSFKIAHMDIPNIFLYVLTILSILAVALIPPCTVSVLSGRIYRQ